METKICTKCGIEKKLEQFRKSGKYYRGECKECEREYKKIYDKTYQSNYYKNNIVKIKEYRENHKEYYKEYNQKYYQEHKQDKEFIDKRKKYREEYVRPQESIEKHKLKAKEWRKNNKEYVRNYERKYNEEHIEKIRINRKIWEASNKEKLKKYQQNDYNKRANDPILRLKRNIRNRLNYSFKEHNYRKNTHTEEILGCKIDDFILHLMQTYKDNYGYEWDKIEPVHIDHIIPLSIANTKDDVIKLCHYTNLQLLKAKDNLSKNNSLSWKLNS